MQLAHTLEVKGATAQMIIPKTLPSILYLLETSEYCIALFSHHDGLQPNHITSDICPKYDFRY